MELLNKFLGEYSFLFEFVAIFIYVVFGLILFGKTKNINSLKEVLDTVKKFMYRTEQQALDESQASNGQVFSEYKSEYRLNKTTDELEKQEELINIQEMINSAVDVALDRVLEKFLPPQDQVSNEIVELNTMEDDLDMLMQANNIAEDYREAYCLPNEFTSTQIFEYIKTQATTLKNHILEAQQKRAEAEAIRKEIKNNEKEIVEESKQA